MHRVITEFEDSRTTMSDLIAESKRRMKELNIRDDKTVSIKTIALITGITAFAITAINTAMVYFILR